MPSSRAAIAVKAAPRGNRCGLLAVRAGSQSLLLAVLPKFWRGGAPQNRLLPEAGADARHLVTCMYEGDVLVVPEASSHRELVLAAVAETVDSSYLIGPAVGIASAGLKPASTDLSDLWPLFALRDRLRESQNADVPISAASSSSPAFTRAALVLACEPLVRQVHQGYFERSDRLTSVRGRIDSREAELALARGDTQLMCRFDDLRPGSDVHRVVVTALDLCATPRDAVTSSLMVALGGIERRAVELRRAMRQVTSLSTFDALALGRRLLLGRRESSWRNPLRLALSLLSEHHDAPSPERTSEVSVVHMTIATERLWESLLEDAIRRKWPHAHIDAVNHNVPDAVRVLSPWIDPLDEGQKSFPDFVVQTPEWLWLADAKYKRATTQSGLTRAARDDEYQMFAYSWLVSSPSHEVTRAALLYPCEPGEKTSARSVKRAVGTPLEMDLVTLPFPTPQEAGFGLASYLRRLSLALPEIEGEPVTVDR